MLLVMGLLLCNKMLRNSTRKTTISKNLKFCNNIFSKAIGLMFSKKKDRALVFTYKKEIRESLHMLFVFYPIDVLFLNRDKKIVEIKQNFRPFTFYMPKNKAQYIVELPAGSVKGSKTKVEDKLSF
ncbi:DUF192 domain-containing protein [Candidatus Woesearchaeota archaeon]|nr:DUF192 domain-containing protein [Candidatus Woesearchaeota archaeon]